MKSISSASKLRQWQVWRAEICAAKIRKLSRISDESAASAKYLKNPRYRRAQLSKARQLLSGPFQRNLKSVLVATEVPPTVKVTLGDPSSVIVPAAESFAVRAVAIAEAFGVSRVK
jgi:hypothetical protein